MKKKIILSSLFLYSGFAFSQVGINTTLPSEKLDVNGTLRVNTLPQNNGTSNTDSSGNYSATGVTYSPNAILVTNAQGVVGQVVAGTDTTDASNAMFVLRRYSIADFPSGSDGGLGVNLGMTTAKWEAVMSNVRYELASTGLTSRYNNTSTGATNYSTFFNQFNNSTGANTTGQQNFVTPVKLGWRLSAVTTGLTPTWRIIGDINGSVEQATVDVLFINKKFVFAETRTN